MTPDQQFILALLAIFVPSVFALTSSVVLVILNKRMKEYHDTVNSKMDKLLEAEKMVSRGEGVIEGMAKQKSEQRQETADRLAADNPQPVTIVQEQPLDVKVVTPPEEATMGTSEKPMQVEVVQPPGGPVPVEVVNPDETQKENKS